MRLTLQYGRGTAHERTRDPSMKQGQLPMTKPCPSCGANVPASDTRCNACRFTFPLVPSPKQSKVKWMVGGSIGLLVAWAIVPTRAPNVPIQMVKRSETATEQAPKASAPIPPPPPAPTGESKIKLFSDCLGLPPNAAPSAWRSVHGDVHKAVTFIHMVYSGDVTGKPLSHKERTCLVRSGLTAE